MNYFSKLVSALLIITMAASHAHAIDGVHFFPVPNVFEVPDPRNLSYDEVMQLLEWIESDAFKEECSIDNLARANQLISFLALEGATEDEQWEVKALTRNLFGNDECRYAFWVDADSSYAIQSAVFTGDQARGIPCRSWVKKQWDQTRSFVKEHKKAIIIGTIVVVAVTVVKVLLRSR